MTTTPRATTTSGGSAEGKPRSRLRRLLGGVRGRVLAYFFLLNALALLAAVLIVAQLLLVRVEDRVDADLRQEVEEFRRLATGTDPETGESFGGDAGRIFEVYLERNVPGAGEQLITVPRRGPVRFRGTERAQEPLDRELLDSWRTLREPVRGETATADGHAEYLAVPVIESGRPQGAFAVAYLTDQDREDVWDVVRILALVGAGVLLGASAIAYLAAGRVLAPLRELRDAARSVSGERMSERIEVGGSDEIAELATTFNAMLDRLESAFLIQRRFLRDASHELRTPIAIVRGHLELLASGEIRDRAEVEEVLALLTGELDRMSRFVDDLLVLARAEQPGFLELETVRLDLLADEVLAKARGLADRRWAFDGIARRSIVADHQRLTQAVLNLVENAVAHTEDGDEIAVGLVVDGPSARIWVRDSGEGIPAEELEGIFNPFQRGSASRGREGAGLGLSIVQAIAEAHHGRVEIDSELGHGTRVTIVLPVDEPWDSEGP